MILKKLFVAASLLLPLGAAADDVTGYIGFTPLECSPGEVSAQGTNTNQYLETAIRLDPQTTPRMTALEGCKIVGVRCYLRTDYKQKSKGYSRVNLYPGELTATPLTKTVNFKAGWNEVMFDEPYVIGSEPVYVGYQVFELMGSNSLPLVSWSGACVNGGYLVRASRGAWEEVTDRGSILVQAIVTAPDGTKFAAPGALAQPTNYPRITAPDEPFDGSFYVHNFSSEPLTSLEITGLTTGHTYPLTLDKPIPGYGSALVPAQIWTGAEEGNAVALKMDVTAVNGTAVSPAHHSVAQLYVSKDNFLRVPLIEEYTSLYCVNCPFMAYFLEKAREEFGKPHVFIAHHSGFRYDDFTQPVDKELEYIFFGEKGNPYATYDRTLIKGEKRLVVGARVAEAEPYVGYLTECYDTPALASVNVTVEERADSRLTATVSGRMSLGDKTADGNVYLSAYVVEDNIPRGTVYEQAGVDFDFDPTSPADLKDTYRHNGVIRRNLCTETLGDLVHVEADGSYAVTYPAFELEKGWNPANCHVVAFLHRINKVDMKDNYVLNAGDSRPLGAESSIEEIQEGPDALRYRVGADGRVIVGTAARAVRLYTLEGVETDAGAPHAPGIYVLSVTLPSGAKATRKIAIR